MKGPVQFPQTPITEGHLKGWKKEFDSDNEMEEIYQYTLNLPKESREHMDYNLYQRQIKII